jgi:hypothetical protein
MEEIEYYYLMPPVTGESTLTALAQKLVNEAKCKHSYVVYATECLSQIVDQLRERADELKEENPRCKLPKVWLSINEWTGNGTLHIDNWAFQCHKVKRIIKL